jgi:hypothetical protein
LKGRYTCKEEEKVKEEERGGGRKTGGMWML